MKLSNKIFKSFIGIVFTIITFFGFSQIQLVKAEVPSQFNRCIPVVSSFKVTPVKLAKRTDAVKLAVAVRTRACIISQIDGEQPKWLVRALFATDSLVPYPGSTSFALPNSGYIRGSDFKDVGGNNYEAIYTQQFNSPFTGQTGNTITLIPNIYWEWDEVNVNNSLAVKLTAPALVTNTNTNTNSNANGNSNSNTGQTPNSDVTGTLGDLDTPIGSFFNPLEKRTLPELMAAALRILFAMIGMLAVIVIIVAGFRMVLANGDETALTAAKKAISAAVIGLILSLMAFSIVAIVQKLIGG